MRLKKQTGLIMMSLVAASVCAAACIQIVQTDCPNAMPAPCSGCTLIEPASYDITQPTVPAGSAGYNGATNQPCAGPFCFYMCTAACSALCDAPDSGEPYPTGHNLIGTTPCP